MIYAPDFTEREVISMALHTKLSWMSDHLQHVEILRVMNGWIYTTTDMEDDARPLMTSVFVPAQI